MTYQIYYIKTSLSIESLRGEEGVRERWRRRWREGRWRNDKEPEKEVQYSCLVRKTFLSELIKLLPEDFFT